MPLMVCVDGGRDSSGVWTSGDRPSQRSVISRQRRSRAAHYIRVCSPRSQQLRPPLRGWAEAVEAAGRAARRARRAVLLPANFVGWSDQDVLK